MDQNRETTHLLPASKALTSIVLFFAGGLLWAQTAMGSPQDAIKEVIKEAYVDGVFNEGNLRNIELGFAADFKMLSLEDNEIKVTTLADWIRRVKENQAAGNYPPEPQKMVRVDYLSIDVEGDVAVAKLRFYRGNKLEYIDFITLFHFDEGWKITGKVFHQVPKAKD